MKKLSLVAIQTLLSDLIADDPTNEAEYGDILAEVTAELNKGTEAKAARAAAYEGIHRVIVDNLSDTYVSFSDLWPEIEPEVIAKGMTKHNAQWALNNLWQDEITRMRGNPNTYARKS